MMISPEAYYKMELEGMSRKELLREIRSLKREISGLERMVKAGEDDGFLPSPGTRLSCNRQYLERAEKALEEIDREQAEDDASEGTAE